jgi:multidrug efflux system membrane fusion protein
VQRGAQGDFVFVVEPDKTVSMRTVKLGASDATKIVIRQGLKPGDTVVVDGADRLRDGAEVTLPNATAPIAKPSASTSGTSDDRASRRAKMAAALKQFCADDMKKYCPNAQPGPDTFMCLRQNRDNFSTTCQTALKKLRAGRRGGGGGGP